MQIIYQYKFTLILHHPFFHANILYIKQNRVKTNLPLPHLLYILSIEFEVVYIYIANPSYCNFVSLIRSLLPSHITIEKFKPINICRPNHNKFKITFYVPHNLCHKEKTLSSLLKHKLVGPYKHNYTIHPLTTFLLRYKEY